MTAGHNLFCGDPGGAISSLLPAAVIAVEADGRGAWPPLWPEETECVAGAVWRRRREFAFGRGCAHAALARLGVPPQPLLPGSDRAPRWPGGVVGSITHCDGYYAAAVARDRDLAAVGIDAEPHRPMTDGVLQLIATETDLAQLPRGAGLHWDRLLFSAKESAYKAWYALTGTWLDAQALAVTWDPASGAFTVAVDRSAALRAAAYARFVGRFAVHGEFALTAAIPST